MKNLLYFMSLCAVANTVNACSCVEGIDFGQQIKSANAVFVGTVTSIEQAAVRRTTVAHLLVSHAIKGTTVGATLAVDYSEGTDCRAPVEQGRQIVVIAYGSSGNLATSECSAWLITRAPEEIWRLLDLQN